MQEQYSPSVLVVTGDAAAILSAPHLRKFLTPFLTGARSVADVARELGVPRNAMLYRVQRMLAVNLLKVERTERRAGRPIRYYRATADRYFLPFRETPWALLEQALRDEHRDLEGRIAVGVARALTAQHGPDAWGLTFESTREGDLHVTYEPRPQRESHSPGRSDSVLLDYWLDGVTLSTKDAVAFQEELRGVLRKYLAKQQRPGRHRFVVRLALVPEALT